MSFILEQAGEVVIALGFRDILHDLGFEGFGRGELALFAEAVEEGEFERGFGGERERIGCWVVVEQVGFDRVGVFAEGGAVAGVGDGVEGLGRRRSFGVT